MKTTKAECVQSTKSITAKKILKNGVMALVCLLLMFGCINVGLAANNADYKGAVNSMLGTMIGIISFIFRAVGIVLSVYSVGQLVLAFKNEDADSKSRAATMLVVGVVLIALPTIIDALDILNL